MIVLCGTTPSGLFPIRPCSISCTRCFRAAEGKFRRPNNVSLLFRQPFLAHNGFTLVELLVVITIIGYSYFVATAGGSGGAGSSAKNAMRQ